jgi:hypothetical protein
VRAKLSRMLLTLVLLMVSTGCGLASRDRLPTPIPPEYLPTAIAMTAVAANSTFEAVLSGTPTAITLSDVSPTPSPLPLQPTETSIPLPEAHAAAIQIQSPGSLSKVASPIQLKANLIPGAENKVQVELFSENVGDVPLFDKLVSIYPAGNGRANLSMKIPFEIRPVSELGKLQISTKDKQGRPQSLVSVYLTLLSIGDSELNFPVNLMERCILSKPLEGDTVSGGTLIVQGVFQPFNNQQVVVELLKLDGSEASVRLLDFVGTAPQTFTTTLPYSVSEPTQMRLVVRQDDEKFSGLRYLFSEEIWLTP